MAAAGLPEGVAEPVTNVQNGRLWWLFAEAIQDELFRLAGANAAEVLADFGFEGVARFV